MTTVTTLQAENATLRAGQNTVDNEGNTNSRGKSKKPDRPIINAGIDDREWALFIDTWTRYKSMIGVDGTDVVVVRQELRTACSTDVNKLLFEFVGATTLNACTEAELLGHIKSVAVKTVHKEVHQMAFNKMMQNQGESITNYVARLKSKAFLCQFEIRCTCNPPVNVSYAEEMVSQRLVAGLSNPDHQRKILSEAATLTPLAEKVKRLQILETTEESATVLHKPPVSSESAAQHSSYQRNKKGKGGGNKAPSATNPGVRGQSTDCKWCGKATHPNGKPMDHVNCPAYEKVCWTCNKKGHLREVCEKSQAAPADEQPRDGAEVPLVPLPSESAVSFSFASHQDFRPVRKRTGNS